MRTSARAIPAVLILALGACGRDGPGADPAASAQQAQAQSQRSYARPPEVIEVRRAATGFVVIGKAPAGARVRGLEPSGRAFGATTNDAGAFALSAPNGGGPMLLALSAESGRHAVPAEGWLFVPPDHPERAVLLRAGAPARPISLQAGLIAAIDYDAAGGAGVSGVAAPGATVEVQVDGGATAKARADARGVYGRSLGDEGRLPAGAHRLTVTSPGGAEVRTADFIARAPGTSFRAVRERAGWRVDWGLPGGGAQSTFVFVPAAAS